MNMVELLPLKVYSVTLLAWLFWKKTSRYCHSPGVFGSGVGGIGVMQKL